LTTSIAELPPPVPHQPVPHRPVLRRLVDILPATPAIVTPPAPDPTVPDPTGPDPAAVVVVERVLRAAVEILGGQRPAQQLSAVLRPDLLSYLVSLRLAAGHLEPRLRKVLVLQHTGNALEAVALVTLNTGVRALAARFEQHPDHHASRWRCTALQVRFTTGDLAAHRTRRPYAGVSRVGTNRALRKAPTLPPTAEMPSAVPRMVVGKISAG
jgi:Family of unknown function (DUF6459)